MRYAVYPPNFGHYGDALVLADLAARAEASGWDGLFVWDHLVAPAPVADPWVALAAIARATSRLTIGPLIVPLARRRPQSVALASLTLQRLSGGRFVLGGGLGVPPDFTSFGEDDDWRVRARRLEEGLRTVRALWEGDVDGVDFGEAPPVPLWTSGVWPRRAPFHGATLADGIFPLKLADGGLVRLAPDEVGELRADLPERATRDLVLWTTADADPVDERAYDGAGATWCAVSPGLHQPPEDYERVVEAGPPR